MGYDFSITNTDLWIETADEKSHFFSNSEKFQAYLEQRWKDEADENLDVDEFYKKYDELDCNIEDEIVQEVREYIKSVCKDTFWQFEEGDDDRIFLESYDLRTRHGGPDFIDDLVEIVKKLNEKNIKLILDPKDDYFFICGQGLEGIWYTKIVGEQGNYKVETEEFLIESKTFRPY
jgi:hypothetical protein